MTSRSPLRTAVRNALFLSSILALFGVVLLSVSVNLRLSEGAGISSEIVRDIGILFMSVGLISIAYELLIRKQLLEDYNILLKEILDPDSKRLGVINLFRNRSEKHQRGLLPEVVIREAHSEVFCLGLGLINFVPEQRELIRFKISQGCSFRFLVFNVAGPGSTVLDSSLGYSDMSLLNFIGPAVGAFSEFQKSLLSAGIGREKFDVRVYDTVPPWGLIAIDHRLRGGRIFVEINGKGVEGSTCPGFSITHSEDGWYSFFASQLESIWLASKPVIVENLPDG